MFSFQQVSLLKYCPNSDPWSFIVRTLVGTWPNLTKPNTGTRPQTSFLHNMVDRIRNAYRIFGPQSFYTPIYKQTNYLHMLSHQGHSSKLMTNTKLFSVLSLLAACLILFLIETISFVFDHFPIYCFSSWEKKFECGRQPNYFYN